jgi:two-component system, OmpR family, sensor kinase
MRRRLLFVLLSTVVLALAVSGIGTFELLRRDEQTQQVERLSQSADRLAATPDVIQSLDVALTALELTSAAIVSFDTNNPSRKGLGYDSQKGLPVNSLIEVTSDLTDADLRAVANGTTVARVSKGFTWSMAPIQNIKGRFSAIVLVAVLPDTARRVVSWLAIGSLAALLLAAGSAFVIAQQLTRPLRVATGAYRRIAAGDLTVRIGDRDRSASRKDEVGELLRTLDTMAEALDRARVQERQFLLSVSHDLRTPLTSIRGYAEALADGAADPARSAEVIANEARRLERLVQDLLDLAKLEARQFTLNPKDVDLTDVVTDAADGFLPAAERVDVELLLDVEPDVRSHIDRDRFAQVLANLIENALKYAEKQVRVTLTTNGRTATVAVRDDGPGIAPDDLPRVFERSFTSDRKPTRQIGSGIGLAIVKELVETMAGTIRIETNGDGTAFLVTIPSL